MHVLWQKISRLRLKAAQAILGLIQPLPPGLFISFINYAKYSYHYAY